MVLTMLCPFKGSAQKTVEDLLRLLPSYSYYSTDLPARDTFIDETKRYFEIAFDNTESNSVLMHGICLDNTDGSKTLVITGVHSDQQCRFYHTYFFEYAPAYDSLKQLADTAMLPETQIHGFLEPNTSKVVSKYMRKIRRNYLGDKADLNDALHEFYSMRYILSQGDTGITATLSVCDYIFSVVSVSTKDRQAINTGFSSRQLYYDSLRKKFLFKEGR